MRWPWRKPESTPPVVVSVPASAYEQIRAVPLPSIRAELPPCAPYPDHQPHEYRGVCFQCSGNTKAALLHLLPDHECARAPYWEIFKPSVGDLQTDMLRDALADATETITNPYAQETPVTTPDPAAVALADAAPDNAFRTEDGGALVRLANGWVLIKNGEARPLALDAVVPGFGTGRNTVPLVPETYTPKWETYVLDAARAVAAGERPRSIDTAGPDPSTPPRRVVIMREDEVGSSAWLRDLADRLQQHIADRCALPDEVAASTSTFSPDLIRRHADDVERDERQAVADTRDRERVETILRGQSGSEWTRDGAYVGPARLNFGSLPANAREEILTNALELYRAGRDDQEGDRG
ncbi:hypothetical protein TPB0596_12180 [Tsukamurella pulmonis]|uniref:hypothetical protein n=1 Tax=Tsukamurella pulmonis TaxID=47312 RepID=UPI001EDFFD81|nr:hypothetical protein [Tsukamurella pulmonis]BDD81455.1 hypothetical protein TPB0596_12180 [Tsukamurella pulmonis]